MIAQASLFSKMGSLKCLIEKSESSHTRAKPKMFRKICLVDNKHNPDFYIVGRVAGFLGLKVLCRWYPVLKCKDGSAAFLKGMAEAEACPNYYEDIIGDLWRVRRSDPETFDAALCLKHGGVRQAEILSALFTRGQQELERLQEEQACEMEFYGLIDDEWLSHRKHSKEKEIERETVNAQL